MALLKDLAMVVILSLGAPFALALVTLGLLIWPAMAFVAYGVGYIMIGSLLSAAGVETRGPEGSLLSAARVETRRPVMARLTQVVVGLCFWIILSAVVYAAISWMVYTSLGAAATRWLTTSADGLDYDHEGLLIGVLVAGYAVGAIWAILMVPVISAQTHAALVDAGNWVEAHPYKTYGLVLPWAILGFIFCPERYDGYYVLLRALLLTPMLVMIVWSVVWAGIFLRRLADLPWYARLNAAIDRLIRRPDAD